MVSEYWLLDKEMDDLHCSGRSSYTMKRSTFGMHHMVEYTQSDCSLFPANLDGMAMGKSTSFGHLVIHAGLRDCFQQAITNAYTEIQ